jgi:hypothetical protein
MNTHVAFLPLAGKPVLLSVLSLGQHEQLVEYLRFAYMEEMRRRIHGLPPVLAAHAWQRARHKADRIYPGRVEHAEHVFTFRGLCYVLYLASGGAIATDDAGQLLQERHAEALEVARKCLGYECTGNTPMNEPLPINSIMHVLTNEPYCHTPDEVRDMSPADIAVIWNAGEDKHALTQADQTRIVEEFRRKCEREALGVWGEASVWNKEHANHLP